MKAALIADDGKVVTGQCHGDCFAQLSASEQEHDICSGFLDEEHGKFISEDCEFYLKQIILVRHAESDKDGPLTERGQQQAARTASFLSHLDLRGFQFFTSPRRRCVETSTFFTVRLSCNFIVDYKIDEQSGKESHDVFLARIHQMLDWLPVRSLVICHCDVIHEAAIMASGGPVEFPACIPNCSLTYIDNHHPVWIAREFFDEISRNGTG
jgi:broad specificity phosphatase PhoE